MRKYFEKKGWSAEADRTIRKANPQVQNGRWTGYPTVLSQKAFLDWFWDFQKDFLYQGRGKYDASPDQPLAGSDCKRRPDIFLAPSSASKHDDKYKWIDVRVIGELKQSEIRGKYVEELLNFCGHAREVFAAQPTRRFLHGFIIRGSDMELWVFDRSGPYGSVRFNIHEDPCLFIRIMFGYTRMDDDELGMNTYIKEDETGKYISFRADGKSEERFYLEDKPIASQRAIVCRGTACYRAKKGDSESWEYVVKFAWRSDKRQAEGELLKLAGERNVWGVAKWIGHSDLGSISDMRSGLRFGKSYTFRTARRDDINQCHSTTQGISMTPVNTPSPGSKRKELAKAPMAPPRKRSKLGSHVESATVQANRAIGNVRSRCEENPSGNSPTAPEIRDDHVFENRIFSCLIISPPGRPVRDFTSILEFLQACLDFLKGHRSLYHDGKILHRDVSENNIIITKAERDGDPRGMIIDLDLAIELDGRPSGAKHRTGTMQFMAIEILEGEPHTYRHDLESFFYVMLWVMIQLRYGFLPETSRLRSWYAGSYEQIANQKRGHMDKRAFKRILAEFQPAFHGFETLAEKVRDILFPYREGLFTGTYADADRLYLPMMNAFKQELE